MPEKFNPQITSELLTESGFRLPGQENHISLVTEPITIGQKMKTYLEKALPKLCDAIMLARAYDINHNSINQDLLNILKQMPAIWRFDFLLTPRGELKMLELNGTRPGGMYLLLKAAEVLKNLGLNDEQLWVPRLNSLGNFFYSLVTQSNNPLVALAYTEGYVGEIEMPSLASMLNQWSREIGLSLEFVSFERREFSKSKEGIIDPKGRPVDVFYENAGPQQLEDKTVQWLFDERGNTKIINGPLVGSCDNKALMAVLHNDKFRQLLIPQQQQIIDELVPKTYLLSNFNDLKPFLENRDNFFFKICDGLKASSGRGVYNGLGLTDENINEITSLMNEGHLFVAQERIPPEKPKILVSWIEPGNKSIRESCFVDLNPYVLYNGQTYEICGALTRAKPSHPINVTQGGALSVVRII